MPYLILMVNFYAAVNLFHLTFYTNLSCFSTYNIQWNEAQNHIKELLEYEAGTDTQKPETVIANTLYNLTNLPYFKFNCTF